MTKSAKLPGVLCLVSGIIFLIAACLWLFYYPDGSTQLLCALGTPSDCQEILQIATIRAYSVPVAILGGFFFMVFGLIFLSERKNHP